MSLGTPRRMKTAYRCPATTKKDRLPPKGAGREVVVYLVPRACRGGIFNGVVTSRGTPRRMKMASRCPATEQK